MEGLLQRVLVVFVEQRCSKLVADQVVRHLNLQRNLQRNLQNPNRLKEREGSLGKARISYSSNHIQLVPSNTIFLFWKQLEG